MVKTISKYIFREFFPPALIGIAFFTFVMILPQIKPIVQLKINNNIPLDVILRLFIYLIPITAAITIPMGVLFGAIFSLSRMSSDSEMIAIRANGISFKVILYPSIMFGLLSCLIAFLFVNFITPEANLRYRTLYLNILYSNPNIVLDKKQFMNIPNSKKKIAAVETSNDGQTMNWVFIYEENEKAKEELFIHAEEGRWINNEINSDIITLELKNGQLLRLKQDNLTEVERSDFEKIEFNIKSRVKQLELADRTAINMSAFEIREKIKTIIQEGKELDVIWVIELHKKFALPLACLVFVMISVPISIYSSRSGRGVSFTMTTVVIFLYYLFMLIGETFGKRGFLNPSYSMYLPVVITFIVAMILIWRRTQKEFE